MNVRKSSFYKCHQAGNDFLVGIRLSQEEADINLEMIPQLCDRHQGLGADGVMFVFRSRSANADFRQRLFNSDGSEAELSGNGLCCLGKVLYDTDNTAKETIIMETLAGPRTLRLHICKESHMVDSVRVEMPKPDFTAARVPVAPQVLAAAESAQIMSVEVDGFVIEGSAVNVGNPHFVVFCDHPEELMKKYGTALESHPAFPARINVQFARIISKNEIELWPHERGAGPTLACGSGATATVASAVSRGMLPGGSEVKVRMPGGCVNLLYTPGQAPVIRGFPQLVAGVESYLHIEHPCEEAGSTD